ncbi:hypothetical protein Cenrod_0763 [Candidatus Symbiobacter mobilis CR]|uniref:Uncharacterized protein n=1 Tax=Candidatus Symbiobacter mobilis CR TaxID=946483 RepID=U5N9M5_9BURK|nr:hypothetical protein Cenrod_0763 [Candidatus Symbiobacter mobilis CR]
MSIFSMGTFSGLAQPRNQIVHADKQLQSLFCGCAVCGVLQGNSSTHCRVRAAGCHSL